jgi:hypothetical protein
MTKSRAGRRRYELPALVVIVGVVVLVLAVTGVAS